MNKGRLLRVFPLLCAGLYGSGIAGSVKDRSRLKSKGGGMFRSFAAKAPGTSVVIGLCCIAALTLLSCKPAEPESRPALRLISPNGGETFTVGREIVIRWEANLDSVTGVDILFSPDNGITLCWPVDSTIFPENPLWGAFPWTIPEELACSGGKTMSTVSNECFIKVQEYQTTDPAIEDFSDAPFTIAAP